MSAAAVSAAPPSGLRSVVLDVALNIVVPYAGYVALRQAGQTEARAVLVTAILPVVVAAASLLYRRRINMLSLLVIATGGLSLLASYLSGSAWFTLVRPSFITGTIALVFAASLAAPRPTLFYLARDTTCPTPEAAAAFEANWVQPRFRRAMRYLTVVWAAFLAGEALVRMIIAAVWPNPTLIAATQILWIVLPILLIRWSIRAGRRLAQG